MGPQALSTDICGPLPKGLMGLLLGRSSVTMKGLTIMPGVTDSDYEGEIKVMAQAIKNVITISPGDKTAQLLLLPFAPHGQIGQHQKRETKAFGSSNAAYWIQKIGKERPEMK